MTPGIAPSARDNATLGWRGGGAALVASLRANPTLPAVCAEGFLTRAGFGMVDFALPLYALSLGLGLGEVGVLYALRPATTVLVKPLMGWAADRFGSKRILVLAVFLRCLVGLLLAFSTVGWQLYVARFLHGAMAAARDPSAAALIAEHADKRTRASAFAWYITAREFGHASGYTAVGLLLYASGSYQVVFLAAFATSCVALLTVVRYVRERREAHAERPTPLPAAPAVKPGWAFYRGLLPHAGLGLTVAGSAEMMKGLFPVIATQYAHLTEAQAGLAAGASTIAVLVGGPLFGWLSDHVSRKGALGSRSVANFLSSLLYVFFPSLGGFLVARALDDTGKAAFRPTWGAILAEASDADPSRRARTVAFLDSAYTLGEVLAPVGAGALMAALGVPGMLGVRAALSLVAEGQALWLFRGHQGPREKMSNWAVGAPQSPWEPSSVGARLMRGEWARPGLNEWRLQDFPASRPGIESRVAGIGRAAIHRARECPAGGDRPWPTNTPPAVRSRPGVCVRPIGERASGPPAASRAPRVSSGTVA